ncbi:MAG TPA: prepilin-type N-terminal cleavage/methylation domain-containing protein [Gemmatimonadales bacterium]|nr:prepilin-type N-terminal cleavage/methylation domain-containing protein [Gemmatimonadales bacterium]
MNNRGGFTLIEVIMAMTILLVVMMLLAKTTGNTVHVATTTDRQEAAIELAMDRVEQVRTDPVYDSLETRYVATETVFPTLPGVTRVTVINRTGGPGLANDYKRIEVTVSGRGIAPNVIRTATVAAP